MEKLSNKEYIEQLQRILEEEKSKENEDIQLPEYDIEIQNQQKEIQSLEKEINLLSQSITNKNSIDISNLQLNNNYINTLQKKLMDDLNLKLNTYFTQNEKNMNQNITETKIIIDKKSETIINNKFDQVLNEIKNNNEKIKNDCEKNQKIILNNIYNIYQKIQSKNNFVENKDNKNIKE